MVNAKKEKKGTGAERRAQDRAYGKPVSGAKLRALKAKSKAERHAKKRKERKAKKESEGPTRDFSLVATAVRRLCAVLFAVAVFSRGSFGEAFGHGTGVNKAAISPISIAVYGAYKSDFVQNNRNLEIKAKLMSRGLMMPGEFLAKKWPKKMAKSGGLDLRPPKPSKKYGGQGPRDPLGDKARAAVSHLMADKGMAALVRYQSKDLVVAGGAACVIGAIISPIFVGADIVNMFGMAGFYAGVSQVGGRISPLFWYVVATIVVSNLAQQFEQQPDKPGKRTYTRKKRRADADEQEDDDDDEEEEEEEEDDDDDEEEEEEESDSGEAATGGSRAGKDESQNPAAS